MPRCPCKRFTRWFAFSRVARAAVAQGNHHHHQQTSLTHRTLITSMKSTSPSSLSRGMLAAKHLQVDQQYTPRVWVVEDGQPWPSRPPKCPKLASYLTEPRLEDFARGYVLSDQPPLQRGSPVHYYQVALYPGSKSLKKPQQYAQYRARYRNP